MLVIALALVPFVHPVSVVGPAHGFFAGSWLGHRSIVVPSGNSRQGDVPLDDGFVDWEAMRVASYSSIQWTNAPGGAHTLRTIFFRPGKLMVVWW